MRLKHYLKHSKNIELAKIIDEVKSLLVEQIWLRFDAKISPIEKSFKNQLIAKFTKVQKEVAEYYKKHQVIHYNRDEFVDGLLNVYINHLKQGIAYGLKRAKEELPHLKNFDQLVLDFFNENEILAKVAKADQMVYEKLLEILKEGIKEGLSINDMVKKITTEFDQWKRTYAEIIALTEVARASNWAYLNQMKQAGFTAKKYITALDERVCPICGSLNGKIVDIDEDFEVSFTMKTRDEIKAFSGKYPPLHPRCRCTIVSLPLEKV